MTTKRVIDHIAERAGVTSEQAEAVLAAMRHPTEDQCNAADDRSGPSFDWSHYPSEVVQHFTNEGWNGMTSLQFRFAKHARSWRMMCDALLRPAKYDYQIEPFPHPSGDMRP